MRWALVLAIVALAGCGQPAHQGGAPAASSGPGEAGVLHGAVLDPALRPLPGALVRLANGNATAMTNDQGIYSFAELPRNAVLILMVSHAGFQTGSRQTTLPAEGDSRLDVVLDPLPDGNGYVDVLKFNGRIGCQGDFVVSTQFEQAVDCGKGVDSGNQTVWDVTIAPRLAGAVIEITWTPASPAAEGLGARLEHVTSGGTDPLAETVGRSPLRLVVPAASADRLYGAGGQLRVTVFARPITAEDEQAAAASVAVDQAYQAFASLFYIVGPDPTYSFVNATR